MFYWVLIICVRIYFVFSWKTDGLTSLLQEESCPYRSKWECFIDNSPHGNCFNAYRERRASTGEVEARLPGQLLQVQVLHLTILTDKYDTHGYSCSFLNPPCPTDLFIDVHVP